MDLSSENDDSPSYTVAFQDRGDATNFCYLLESFFEGLGDVSADVVPLTIQVRISTDTNTMYKNDEYLSVTNEKSIEDSLLLTFDSYNYC